MSLNPSNFQSIATGVEVKNTSIDVRILNPTTIVSVDNYPAVQNISGSVLVSNPVEVSNLPKDTGNNLLVNINNLNPNFVNPANGSGLKVSVENAFLQTQIMNTPTVNCSNTGFNVNNLNFSGQSIMVKESSQIYDINGNLCVAVQNNNSDYATNTTLNLVHTDTSNIISNVQSSNTLLTNVQSNTNNIITNVQATNNLLSDTNIHLSNIQTFTSSLPSATQATQTNTSLNEISQNSTNIYDKVNSKGQSQIFNGASGVNGVSSAVDVSTKHLRNITVFGNSNGATTLTVQFSNDNVNYYDSQYSYITSSASDFGFNITASPYYFRLKSSNNVTLVAYVNYV